MLGAQLLDSTFIDLDAFSGFLGMPKAFVLPEGASPALGVAAAPDGNAICVCARSLRCGTPECHVREDSALTIDHLVETIGRVFPNESIVSLCAERNWVEWLQSSLIGKPRNAMRAGALIGMKLYVLPNHFPGAYLNVLTGRDASSLEIAEFLSGVPHDQSTFDFLRLTGMPHSAQDIIRFIKSGVPMDVVCAMLQGGSEIYTLARTSLTPTTIDAGTLGLIYFPTLNRHKFLATSHQTKLAVLRTCKEFHLSMHYQVYWDESADMSELYEPPNPT